MVENVGVRAAHGGSGWARCCFAAAVALLGGCVSLPSGSAPPTSASTLVELPASVRQYLFRLVYDSGGGRVSLRVVLRRMSDDRFQLAASDVAGRAVFGLDYTSQRAVLVDHRAGIYCIGGPGLRLTEVHPSELPLAALPRVLRGELPVPRSGLEASVVRKEELVDAEGRRWRAGYEGDALARWSLLDAEGPALWWTRQNDGGILSRRGGEQYRWTLIVAEDAARPLADIVPAGFAEGVCDE